MTGRGSRVRLPVFSSSGFVVVRPAAAKPSSVKYLKTSRHFQVKCSAGPSRDHSSACTPVKSGVSRRVLLNFIVGGGLSLWFPCSSDGKVDKPSSAYDIIVLKDGKPLSLKKYEGKVTLFVNVATYCALTPQYSGLVELHDTFQPRGFEIIAAPCDQFGHQEPGSNQEVCKFAKEQFGARFLLLDKLNVNNAPGGTAPLYQFLRKESPEGSGERVSWNFEKFLVGTNGRVLRRYKPSVQPDQIKGDIEWSLAHPGKDLPPKERPYLGVA